MAVSFLPLPQSADGVVTALLAALELRHIGTAKHAVRVAEIALLLTMEVDADLASERSVRDGYLLHDIGKLGVPDSLLLKPAPLNAIERRIVQRHASLGEELTRSLRLSTRVHEVVGGHHERWDGKGYPRRLAATDIPLAARIFSVVDAFDAMTGHRPYRAALPIDDALREIERCAGTQFDPSLVEAFLALPLRRVVGALASTASN